MAKKYVKKHEGFRRVVKTMSLQYLAEQHNLSHSHWE